MDALATIGCLWHSQAPETLRPVDLPAEIAEFMQPPCH